MVIGAVLAGGISKRFGEDKLTYRVGGKPLILYTIEALESASKIEKIVVIASPFNWQKFRELGLEVIVDALMVGPLGGIYLALSLGDSFVVGGDMPLLVPEFIDYLVAKFEEAKKLACVPRWPNGYLEPLHAVYSRSLREIIEGYIERGEYKVGNVIESSNPCYIPVESLPERWKWAFFNINKKEDLRKLKTFIKEF
ncbi:molybdenum cofactor guanylyltransferase [Pyrococcus furiosus DSM 3638]|uniref:Probable molybdenum cofactor guanylyltransferase n=3 Tax=Pyrococcus furiosus TaxID=2261 RepID=MOBA_PYRFU|nr:molybdenum cofactor guanylyltransferase MobA [Pyrococcus furiosus]Q8U354.1 RecName: Full=Probable molybdenum cofactor guanylyltransferase; Short=MoCo guanylyltransferase; AltName: Full=GTP:molybdopterin guanylyltransferase; AltName: Full=Mo-MPT guanylyltransferase; AltName: Full=Molybdopterin guanylyltransferase; AltName: Full=Molybdopterin-guanine dinucleotide synthase; Short=MGD synthase [Pyrococcus furiosus DSM 3638]AAL80742.1 molybdopterin-guanine dinucleotide biosynthesis protein [Pyrococ